MKARPAAADRLDGAPHSFGVTQAKDLTPSADTPSVCLPPFARCRGLNNLRSPLLRLRRISGAVATIAGGADVEAVS